MPLITFVGRRLGINIRSTDAGSGFSGIYTTVEYAADGSGVKVNQLNVDIEQPMSTNYQYDANATETMVRDNQIYFGDIIQGIYSDIEYSA